MRKVLLMLLGIIVMTGCNKESNPLIGTWALVDFTVINVRTGKQDTAGTDVKTWTFQESGSAYVNGETPLTYSVKDKQLTMKYVSSGKEILYKIEELTDSFLKVYWRTIPGQYQDATDCWYSFTKMP